ncbi:MAG TPA: hypothetical protein VGG33_12590 [Polyangia bacterium]
METTASLAPASPPGRRPWAAPVFWWPATMLALATAAFFPTYFARFPGFEGTTAKVHFHVATMLAWIALTVAQPILIYRRQVELHRRIGQLAYALLPLVAVGFWLVMKDGQLRRKEPELILATAFDAFFYFFLVGMGLICRRRRAYHGPFMMLSLVPFLNPTLGRLISPAVSVPVELLVLVTVLVIARKRRREVRPYAVALTAFVGSLALLVVVMVALPTMADRLWQILFG